MIVKEYVNLTAGLEAFQHRHIFINPISNISFCRLQSSLFEQKAYKKFLLNVPDDMLLHLAKGNLVFIYEATSNNQSKLKKIGQHIIKYALYYFWFDTIYNVKPMLKDTYKKIHFLLKDKDIQKKFNYYKVFLDTQTINLEIFDIQLRKENTPEIIERFNNEFKIINN